MSSIVTTTYENRIIERADTATESDLQDVCNTQNANGFNLSNITVVGSRILISFTKVTMTAEPTP